LLKLKKSGRLIIISSPSGAGKTTIVKKLVNKNLLTSLSVSLTTRNARPNEIDGVDYRFVSKDLFKKKIKKNLFLEYAKVFDNFYGTIESDITKKIAKGKNVLLDIDWQGARQVKKKLPSETISIFILPPSLKELKKRLKKRGENNSFVKKRMSGAKEEIKHWQEYDYILINDNLKSCITKIKNILKIENYSAKRQIMSK
jgi:guanylate kinase